MPQSVIRVGRVVKRHLDSQAQLTGHFGSATLHHDMQKPFQLGEPIPKHEAVAVLTRLVPDVKRRRKVLRNTNKAIAMLNSTVPQRLEHEVNRLRGWAFDGGEPGFEYHWVGETS